MSRVDRLLDRRDCLVSERLIFEQEGQFLERAVVSLRVEQVDEAELEEDPRAEDGEVLPADGVHGDGVDVEREEACELAEELFDADTHGALGVREDLDEVGVRKRVVADVVAGRVGEVEEEGGNLRGVVLCAFFLGGTEALEEDGHRHEAQSHGCGRELEHPSTAEASDDEGDDCCVDQTPALVGDIDASLGVGGGVSHHLEEDVLVV